MVCHPRAGGNPEGVNILGSRPEPALERCCRGPGRQALDIPVDGALEPLAHVQLRAIAEQARRLGDVGARDAHVARAKVAVHGARGREVRVVQREEAPQHPEELVERGLLADRDVVDLVGGFGALLREKRLGGVDALFNSQARLRIEIPRARRT